MSYFAFAFLLAKLVLVAFFLDLGLLECSLDWLNLYLKG